jgi:hypothetical protein
MDAEVRVKTPAKTKTDDFDVGQAAQRVNQDIEMYSKSAVTAM